MVNVQQDLIKTRMVTVSQNMINVRRDFTVMKMMKQEDVSLIQCHVKKATYEILISQHVVPSPSYAKIIQN